MSSRSAMRSALHAGRSAFPVGRRLSLHSIACPTANSSTAGSRSPGRSSRRGARVIQTRPEQFWMPDGTLDDVASGTFEGWPAIRAFFANGLTRTANLTLDPDEFWVNDDGLAVHYVMSGDVVRPESFGPEHVGRRWSVPCMSYLRFDGRPGLLRGRLPRQGRPRQVARHRWRERGPALARARCAGADRLCRARRRRRGAQWAHAVRRRAVPRHGNHIELST